VHIAQYNIWMYDCAILFFHLVPITHQSNMNLNTNIISAHSSFWDRRSRTNNLENEFTEVARTHYFSNHYLVVL